VPSTQVCADASVLAKLVVMEDDSNAARSLWLDWSDATVEVVAPDHVVYEVTSVIRNRVARRLLSPETGRQALEAFLGLPLSLSPPLPLAERAWELASQFERPTLYDAYYLALAESLTCDLWTADERLWRAVVGKVEWVHLLRDHRPERLEPPGE